MYGTLPLRIYYIENKHIIINTNKHLEEKMFCEVYKINGLPIQQYIEEKIFPYIWHEKFDSVYWWMWDLVPIIEDGNEIEIEIKNDVFKVKPLKEKIEWVKTFPFTIKENMNQIYKSDILEVSITQDNLSYIKIPLFTNDNLPTEFYGILPKIKDCNGFIIDVRWNSGGNSNNADTVAQAFINGSFKMVAIKHQFIRVFIKRGGCNIVQWKKRYFLHK